MRSWFLFLGALLSLCRAASDNDCSINIQGYTHHVDCSIHTLETVASLPIPSYGDNRVRVARGEHGVTADDVIIA